MNTRLTHFFACSWDMHLYMYAYRWFARQMRAINSFNYATLYTDGIQVFRDCVAFWLFFGIKKAGLHSTVRSGLMQVGTGFHRKDGNHKVVGGPRIPPPLPHPHPQGVVGPPSPPPPPFLFLNTKSQKKSKITGDSRHDTGIFVFVCESFQKPFICYLNSIHFCVIFEKETSSRSNDIFLANHDSNKVLVC